MLTDEQQAEIQAMLADPKNSKEKGFIRAVFSEFLEEQKIEADKLKDAKKGSSIFSDLFPTIFSGD